MVESIFGAVFAIGPAAGVDLATGVTDSREGFNGLYSLIKYGWSPVRLCQPREAGLWWYEGPKDDRESARGRHCCLTALRPF